MRMSRLSKCFSPQGMTRESDCAEWSKFGFAPLPAKRMFGLRGIPDRAAPAQAGVEREIRISERSTTLPVMRARHAIIGAGWRMSKAREIQPAIGATLPR